MLEIVFALRQNLFPLTEFVLREPQRSSARAPTYLPSGDGNKLFKNHRFALCYPPYHLIFMLLYLPFFAEMLLLDSQDCVLRFFLHFGLP